MEDDLPPEIEYLRCHDQAMRGIIDVVDMPDRVPNDLIRYIRLNKMKAVEKAPPA